LVQQLGQVALEQRLVARKVGQHRACLGDDWPCQHDDGGRQYSHDRDIEQRPREASGDPPVLEPIDNRPQALRQDDGNKQHDHQLLQPGQKQRRANQSKQDHADTEHGATWLRGGPWWPSQGQDPL